MIRVWKKMVRGLENGDEGDEDEDDNGVESVTNSESKKYDQGQHERRR